MKQKNNMQKGKGRGLLWSLILMAAVLGAAVPARAADYVFMYNGGYLAVNNSGNVTYTNSFSPQCVWTCVSNTSTLAAASLGNTAYYLYTEVNGTKYWLKDATTNGGVISVSNSTSEAENCWTNNNNRLIANGSYYLYYNGSWRTSNRSNTYGNYRSTTYNCTTTTQGPTDNTTVTISVASLSSNTITFNHSDLSGTFVPQYKRYVFNNGTHNWYNNTDYGSTVPSANADELSPTYTWSLTANGGGVATINSSTGVVTLSGAPTGNITVQLTVSNISPLSDKTEDFTLTRESVAQAVVNGTVITGPTISPSSVALHYNEGSQVFTSTATAANTTTTVPAHIKLTGGGNTYYYYDGTLYSSTDGFSTTTSTPTDVTLAWSLSGDAATYLTSTPATGGASTTVTHTTQSPSDLTATLTVTASATGASDRTATATITAYGPMVPPTITRDGNTISIASSNAGATIHYTTDGTEPTSLSSPYSAPFDLTESPTIIKAIAIRDDHPSQVATETFMIKLAPPEISMSTGGLATIIISQGAGISYYYTTDGTEPTTSSNPYSSSVQLSNPSIFKAIAVKTNYITSDVATADFINEGVTDDGKVVLDDREDHSWSYYSYSECPLHSLNPADVKIIYNGYGAKYTTQSNGNPSGDLTVLSTTNALVQVGPFSGENQSTFIYFKTLERLDGATADNPVGQCAYRTIPNPFSVRPRIDHSSAGGTGSSATNYTGFYMWRLVGCTGGTVYRSNGTTQVTATTHSTATANANSMVDAEEVLHFAPSSEYGMIVEFEAVWAPAYVTGNTHAGNHNAYERNFYIGAPGGTALSYAATISAIYPDGTNGTNTTLLTAVPNTTQSNSYSCNADTKFEYIQMGASITLTASNHYLCLGRGCGTTNNVMTRVRGMSAGTSDALDYTMRIESGKMNYMAFFKGTYDDDYGQQQGYGGGRTTDNFTNTSKNQARIIIGCDYDRASDVNTNLYINNDAAMGSYCSFSTPTNHHTLHATIKSGTIGATLSDLGDGGDHFVYLGVSRSYQNTGLRQLYIEGGQIGHMAGGIDGGTSTDTAVYVRMTGGHILGCMYGSGAFAAAAGIRKYVITGGNIQGWVAGGCNGVGNNTGGTMDGETFLYFGGKVMIGYNASGIAAATSVNDVVGGTVFAAGRGNTTDGSGRVNNSTLVLADEAKVLNNAYGGGNLGFTQYTANVWILDKCAVGGNVFGGSNIKSGNTTNVYMKGGTVTGGVYGGINGEGYTGSESSFSLSGNTTINISGGTARGGVYGGGYGTNNLSCNVNGTVSITMTGGTVLSGLYGGGNVNSTIGQTVTMQINGGQVGNTSADANIHGGGYGQLTVVTGDVDITLGTAGQTAPGVTVYGNVFGGSALGKVNGSSSFSGSRHTNVTMNQGLINGNIFGGALGQASPLITAPVYGNITVSITGGKVVGNVYGGGDASAYGSSNIDYPQVNMSGGIVSKKFDNTLGNVFGGGKGATATVTGNPKVTLSGTAQVAGNVYGGGDAAAVSGKTQVVVQ